MEGSIHGSGVRVAGEGHEWRHVPVGSLVVGAGALEVEFIKLRHLFARNFNDGHFFLDRFDDKHSNFR